MGRGLTSFLFLVCWWPGFGQIIDFNRHPAYLTVFEHTDDFDTAYLTTLEQAYPLVQDDTIRLAIINDLAYYWHTRNLNRAAAFAHQGLHLAAALKNFRWEGKLQISLGAILLRLESLDSAEMILEQAKNKVREQDLPLLYTQLGYVMERRGLIDKAADFALMAMDLGKKLNDSKAIAVAYSDLSNLFWKQSKFEKGLEYGLEAERLFKNRRIRDMDYSFTLYVIGNNYLNLQEYKKALDYYHASRVMSEQFAFYNNLSDVYIALIDLYTYLKEYKKAESLIPAALAYCEKLANNFMLMRTWLSIGKLQNLMGTPDKAIQSLQTSLRIATKDFGDAFFLHQVYQELSKAYAATGDYRKGYLASLKYDQLKDSVFTVAADHRVAQLQTQFEVAQKESLIVAQQTALRQKNRLQQLSYGVTGLLAMMLAGLYWNFRNKRRTSKQLEQLNHHLTRKNHENELLLKEIHHRVKNNLQTVSSLLALQSAQDGDARVQDALQASQHRVQSMGILHQKLYQGENLASIEMKNYFTNLSNGLLDAFNAEQQVKIECVMQELELDIDTAVPIGLIVNELLTNALKYAFPSGRPGTIHLSLEPIQADTLKLQIADNGIGKKIGVPAQGTGFGSQLVHLLTRQLEGTMTQEVNNGTIISIQVKKIKVA